MGLQRAAAIAGLALGLISGTAHAATYNIAYTGDIGFPDTINIKFSTDESTYDDGYNYLNVLSTSINGLYPEIFNIFVGFYNPVSTYVNFAFLLGNESFLFDLQLKGYSSAASVRIFDADAGAGTFTISAIPLPASAPLFGAAVLALGAAGYGARRKKAAA